MEYIYLPKIADSLISETLAVTMIPDEILLSFSKILRLLTVEIPLRGI